MEIQHKASLLLPQACTWAEEQEQCILETGNPLTEEQIADARQVGVRHPERVRVLRVSQVPYPEDPALVAAARDAGLFFSHTAGMALRYGIFLRADLRNERLTLVHELTHTAQYERLGGFLPFLEQYIGECLTVGYCACTLEREAVAATSGLVKR